MGKFYFTFGSSCGQAFVGGWVEVVAADREAAVNLFRALYQGEDTGLSIVNCAGIYSEEEFMRTSMGIRGENFGKGCHASIVHTVY